MALINQPLTPAPTGKAHAASLEPDALLIGEVAPRSGLTREALRLYEARGILPAPRRTHASYRLYPADVLELLAFGERAAGLV